MENVISIRGLTKKYGKFVAVDGVSYEVRRGEVFGLLGENGAGKTTTLEMVEGLRQATSGEIEVLGHKIPKELNDIKQKIGVQLQSSAYYRNLSLKEILDLFGSFYHKRLSSDELLKMVGLESKSKSQVGSLSGGQKQRFSIVASLVNDPEIVFLDEPTTGLDPLARRHLWDIITDIKSRGKTVVLTTHYMEEAEVLCDRIAIMEKGKVVAIDETHKLIEGAHNPFKIIFVDKELTASDKTKLEALGEMKTIAGKDYHFELKLKTQHNLNQALGVIQPRNPESITVTRASLEDVFVELTGHKMEGEEDVS